MYRFLIFPTASVLEGFLSFLNFGLNKIMLGTVLPVIYEKQQIFCGLAKKGENYSQKPMPKLFSTVFSCSPRTVFSGVKRQKVKLQLTVTSKVLHFGYHHLYLSLPCHWGSALWYVHIWPQP